MLFRGALAFFSLSLTCFAAEAPKLRLPGDARPIRYFVDLTLLPGEKTFKGSVEIDMEFVKPSSQLWLNAAELEIQSSEWVQAGKATKLTADLAAKQFAGFAFPVAVSGKGKFKASFTGTVVLNSTAGVFELKDNGTPYLFSQFEATDARRAFPCFDEPGYKVPFQLTLHGRKTDGLFSNTPQISEQDEPNGMKRIRFAQTKPLPSYLLAFAAGPFEIVPAGKLGKTALRVIVPKGRANEAKFAVATISPLLKLLEGYFGMPYPFEKLDSISLPVSNLAMENPGLITYPQSLLLSAPEKDTIDRQREFAIVAAHEMAHQWFGDLVTTAWWDDIWLNEAFASWMESKIVGQWKPDWHRELVADKEKQGAMRLDSLVSSRKIVQPIESDDDIANAFDSITYLKGAAVINTFEKLVGADKFRLGVRNYMKKYANLNATTPQFLAAISAAAGKDISPAFNTFLDRAGIPLISMELDCKSGQAKLRVSQKRSLPMGSPGDRNAPGSWQVPLCFKFDAGGAVATQCQLLTDPRSEIALKSAKGCPAWVVGNADSGGYYQVNYQGDFFEKTFADNGAHLSLVEKVGQLGNARAMIRTGDLPPAKALSLIPMFAKDPAREVVTSLVDIAGILQANYLDEETQAKGRKFILAAFGERASALGWKAKAGDSDDTKLLRQALVPLAAAAGDQKLIDGAKALARIWFQDHKAPDQDLVGGILSTAARTGDEKLFDQLLAAAREEKDSSTRSTIFGAMGVVRDPALIRKAEALVLTGEFDARESFFPLGFAGGNQPSTRDMPFEFVQANIEKLEKLLPRAVGEDFAAFLPGAGGGFCDEAHRDKLRAFFEPRVKNYSGGPRSFQQTLESINICIGQKKVLEPGIVEFLNGIPKSR